MKFDMHNHHERCGHAIGKIEDYIQAAIDHDLSVIGISDHSPFFAAEEDQPIPGIAMAKSEFEHYVNEVLHLKEQYAEKIDVLLGVESDYFPEHAQLYADVYAQYPMDYIIGSVHRSGETHVFDRKRWENCTEEDIRRQKETYYDLIGRSAKSGIFHILGHIDAMKGYYPDFSNVHTPKVEEAIRIIADCEVAIEVNTSGKMKDCGGWYPADDILELACHYGVDISFGSDAHDPKRIGDDFEHVRTHLRQIGFKQMVYYRQKKRVAVDI